MKCRPSFAKKWNASATVGDDTLGTHRPAATGIGPNRASRPEAESTLGRPHELEAGRKQCVPTDPRDRHRAVLERLPQRLEDRAGKLRQLVEQEDASMSQ